MLDSTINSVSRAWGQAEKEWAGALTKWRDEKTQEFERKFWCEYDRSMPEFLGTLNALNQALLDSQRRIE